MENKWIYFDLFSTGEKTNKWFVVARRGDKVLGEIKWRGAWRQYCFSPAVGTVFNVGCMHAICEFITDEMEQRRQDKRRFRRVKND